MIKFRQWTLADVAKFNARGKPQPAGAADGVLEEIPLHKEIMAECDRRNWLYFHGSTAHRTHRTIGEFDFIILADKGRTFFIECKTKTGKLTQEQAGIHYWANKLGHAPCVVRSLREFLEIVK